MDRSRITIGLALAISILAVFVGIVNIGISSTKAPFTGSTEFFLTTGRAGIARIEIQGPILEGPDAAGAASADRIVRQIHDVRDNPAIRGVLLAINSPGGSVGATKKIYDAIRDLRNRKPVVAAVSDIAASGGYYVASAADQIFAFPGSIVGSIGVIVLHPDVSGLLQRYGVKVTALKAGKFKDSSYPFREMTPDERAMYDDMLQDAYQQFLSDVAEGRKKAIATVAGWADGKIYSGSRAKTEQIIDELGGEDQALASLKLLLKTSEDLPCTSPGVTGGTISGIYWEPVFATGACREHSMP